MKVRLKLSLQSLCNCLKQSSSHLLDSLLQEVCILELVVLKTQRFRCYFHLRYGVCVVYVLILTNKGLLVYFCLYLDSRSIKPQNSKRALTHHQERETKQPSRKREEELDYYIDLPAAPAPPPPNPFLVFPVANIHPVIGRLA